LLPALAAATLVASEPNSAIPKRPDDATIQHVLNRIAFGPRPGDVERVRASGLANYIDQQLHPERIADAQTTERLSGFDTLTRSSRELAQNYYLPAQLARQQAKNDSVSNPSMTTDRPVRTPEQMELARKERTVLLELSQQKILRAAFSERQLEEVMVDFWFNHFNVFAGKGATQQYLTEYERDTIRPHVLGKFRDLLGATAKSPAMLFYLDNWQSVDPDAQQRRFAGRFGRRVPPAEMNPNLQRPRRGINENYARELMELHTLGVDGGYTQDDVVNVARAFTGWTIDQPRQGGGFRFEPRMHDAQDKVVLGHKIKSGGQADGEQVLDILARHPSTAKFIATKLVRRFVSDTPPRALVDRAAKKFQDSGGDIREVVRLIVTSPEFFAPAAFRAKVKTPLEFVVSAIRSTDSDVRSGEQLVQSLRQLGMPLYMCQAPTGYADTADAWVNTGSLLNRMNFAVQLVNGRVRGVQPGNAAVTASTLGSPEFQRR
jgi:uncharacterized protein (DUF1800 family)